MNAGWLATPMARNAAPMATNGSPGGLPFIRCTPVYRKLYAAVRITGSPRVMTMVCS
jgi:hypothetical protein